MYTTDEEALIPCGWRYISSSDAPLDAAHTVVDALLTTEAVSSVSSSVHWRIVVMRFLTCAV